MRVAIKKGKYYENICNEHAWRSINAVYSEKARILLKEGKAVIYKYDPFTIQLTYATGETKQDCHIGIDTGSKHIGMAITSENKVLFKGEIELRQVYITNTC